DYPVYTRPETFAGKKVPKILLSGNHSQITKWRLSKQIEKTKKRRPDLLLSKRIF
ncbi:MAG TPA: tRNA (guanosine(37)-N1)-methyltransferase TrmD, partial [Candidatus Nanoarchaeia archaeon]